MTINADTFRTELSRWLADARRASKAHVDINAGDLHRGLGGYPAPKHAMPTCCNVMHAEMKSGDEILASPPKGRGASLTIRYRLPR